MKEFDTQLETIRNTLKNLITTETPKDTIEAIAKADKALDVLRAEQEKTVEESNGFKTDYINLIKSVGFKSPSSPAEEDISGGFEVSMEQIAQEMFGNK